jgi:flagellar basal body-associated protein FliL
VADEKSKAPPAVTIAPPPPKKSAAGTVVGILLTAILSGGAAFGGAKFGAASSAGAHSGAEGEQAAGIPTIRPPGVTMPLEPFLVTVNDASGKPRAVKVTLALELRPTEKEEALKLFVPRLRDATLTYLRALTFEEAANNQHVEKMRGELLERFTKLGAIAIEQILITDFVTQ